MEGLDIRVMRSEEDLEIIRNREYLDVAINNQKDGEYFAVAALDDEMVGSWYGGLGGYEIPDNVLVREPCFYSNMILVRDKFWDRGAGGLIKRHQLEFARDFLKCGSLYSKVSMDNEYSLKIQRKLGANILLNGKEYSCVFDFDRVNL